MKILKAIKTAMAFLMLVAFVTACTQENKTSKNPTNETGKKQRVEVVNPKQRSFTAEVLITGTARPNQIVTLYAMESGVLTRIRKDIGDRVVKGEIIATLENPEVVQQQIKLKAELQAKRSVYERLNSVYEKTPALTNIQMVENAEAEYLSAKANLDAVNNRLAYLTIRAPFSGVITKRFVDKGSLLQSGLNQKSPQATVEIQEINPIRLTIPVPESDAVAIKAGMPVQVTFPELSGKPYQAKISRTSNALDPMSKTMQVEIDLDNADGKIISGMYAKVMLQINSRENILSLPIISRVSHKNEDYVLAVEDKMVKRIPVKKGLSDKDYFEVLNAEVTEETQVIVEGKGLVNPGQIVEPILKSEEQ
jgi:RND family efflux transporter MFP subunit